MPPPVRQGAPPAYATRFMNSHPFFAHGQPLHTGSLRPFFATLLILPLIVIPMGMTAQIWLQTTDERNVITKEHLDKYHFQVYVIKVLDIVAALVSIPLVSLLLSHAAVACTQRSSKGQTLSLYQLAALANRRWLDLALPSIYFSPFSVGATLLIVLTFINIPLRSILIPSEARLALVCEGQRPWQMTDRRRTWYPACGNHTTIGWEPAAAEPAIDRGFGPAEDDTDPIIQAIIGGLETVRQLEYADRGTGSRDEYTFWPDTRSWVSSVSPEAHTGLIRQHALRYNSSANCESVLPTDFPAECDLENSTAFLSSFVTESLTLRICILSEGSQRFSDIRDAQDITEVMYLSAQGTSGRGDDGEYYNEGFDTHDLGDSTVRCTGTTTRGYFELGSNHNEGRPSDILKEWPSQEVMEADFSDFSSSYSLFNWRTDDRIDGVHFEGSQIGPMLKVAKAFFGPSSYFSRVTELYNTSRETTTYRSLTRLIKPLSNYDFSSDPASTGYESMYSTWRGMSFRQSSGSYSKTDVSRRLLADTAHALVNGFARSDTGTRALSAALHVANDAFLTSLRGTEHPHREIVHYQGQSVLLPRASLTGLIVALVLLCIQVVLIIALWMYINFKPTWTHTLDAMAMMKLGAHLQGRHEFPPLGKTTYMEDDKFLKDADGLVGLVTHEDHLPATADVELADMTPQPQGVAPTAAPPAPAAPGHEEATPQTTQPTASLPQDSVEDTDADANPVAGRPLHRRVSLSSIGPMASPPPSYYGSDMTEEVVPKGPYTLAVGGLGILDRGLYSRHRPK